MFHDEVNDVFNGWELGYLEPFNAGYVKFIPYVGDEFRLFHRVYSQVSLKVKSSIQHAWRIACFFRQQLKDGIFDLLNPCHRRSDCHPFRLFLRRIDKFDFIKSRFFY